MKNFKKFKGDVLKAVGSFVQRDDPILNPLAGYTHVERVGRLLIVRSQLQESGDDHIRIWSVSPEGAVSYLGYDEAWTGESYYNDAGKAILT